MVILEIEYPTLKIAVEDLLHLSKTFDTTASYSFSGITLHVNHRYQNLPYQIIEDYEKSVILKACSAGPSLLKTSLEDCKKLVDKINKSGYSFSSLRFEDTCLVKVSYPNLIQNTVDIFNESVLKDFKDRLDLNDYKNKISIKSYPIEVLNNYFEILIEVK